MLRPVLKAFGYDSQAEAQTVPRRVTTPPSAQSQRGADGEDDNEERRTERPPAFQSFTSSANAAGLRHKATSAPTAYAPPKANFGEDDDADDEDDGLTLDLRAFSSFARLSAGLIVKDGSGREKKITALMQLPLSRSGFTEHGNTIERVSDTEVKLAGRIIRIADTLSEPEPEPVEAPVAEPEPDLEAAAAVRKSLFEDEDLFSDFDAALPSAPVMEPAEGPEATVVEPASVVATDKVEQRSPQKAEAPSADSSEKGQSGTKDIWGEEGPTVRATQRAAAPRLDDDSSSDSPSRATRKAFKSIFDEEDDPASVRSVARTSSQGKPSEPQPASPQSDQPPTSAVRQAKKSSSLFGDLGAEAPVVAFDAASETSQAAPASLPSAVQPAAAARSSKRSLWDDL